MSDQQSDPPTPVRLTTAHDPALGLMTLQARSTVTNAVIAQKVMSPEEAERVDAQLVDLGGRTVEPIAALERFLGPMERYPDLTGCVHSDSRTGFCGPCGRKVTGQEPGEPEYRWVDE